MFKNNSKKLLLLIVYISLFAGYYSNAQENSSPSKNIANVIPSSPDASSLGDFTKFATASSSGAVSKQIPLYNLVEGDISVPVSLAYHGAGFMVSGSPSWVGLGWTLNSGGVVTRQMVGSPDNWSGGTLGKGFLALAQYRDFDYLISGPEDIVRHEILKEIALGCYDAEPDEFSFVTPASRGIFNFHWDSHVSDPEDVMDVDSDNEVTVIPIWQAGYNSEIIGWHVFTADGFLYKFEAAETTTITSSEVIDCLFNWKQTFKSAWYLTEIVNPSRNRFIKFDYEDYTIDNYSITHGKSIVHGLGGNHTSCEVNYAGELKTSSTNVKIDGKRISKIYGSHTDINVEFIPGIDRADLVGTDVKALGEVRVNKGETNLHKYVFSHDHSTGRLTLKEFQQLSATSSTPPYRFEYFGSLPDRLTPTDHWGFQATSQTACDGGNVSDFPTYIWYDATGNKQIKIFGGKEPDYDGSVAGMLSKMSFPTGGYERFQYELNDYSIVANSGQVIDELESFCDPYYVSATGNIDQDCGGGSGTDIDSAPFTIPLHPETGEEMVLEVFITPTISNYKDDYFGGETPPSVFILDGAGVKIHTFTAADSGIPSIVELSSGDYILRAEATFRSCITETQDQASANISFKNLTGGRISKKYAGGVRLKSVSKFDIDDKLLLKQAYNYITEEGSSSGKITYNPFYVSYEDYNISVILGSTEADFTCQRVLARTSSLLSSRHLGYSRIEMVQGDGSNGKIVTEYVSAPDFIDLDPPYHRPITHFLNGVPNGNSMESSTAEVLTETISNIHYQNPPTRSLKIGFKGGIQLREDYFQLGLYTITKGHHKVVSSTRIEHFDDGNFSTLSNFEYDEKLHNLKESSQTTDAGANISRYYYALDYTTTTPSIDGLIANKLYSRPVEVLTIKQVDGIEYVTGGSFFEYDNSFLIEVHQLELEEPISVGSFALSIDNAGNMDPRYSTQANEIFDYDASTDNLQARTTISGQKEVYVWGYNDTRPVFKVVNASKSEVFDLLTSQDLSNLNTDISESDFTTIWSKIHDSLQGAFVTGYRYQIGYGISEIRDPNGLTTNYQYDDLGRLEQVEIDGKVVKSYRYNYAQTQN